VVTIEIRPMQARDMDAVVALSLRAWEPVFESLRTTMGDRLFAHFYGSDWRSYQGADVRRACETYRALVADDSGTIVGFTAVDVTDGREEGEIYMLAVDPDAQGRGVGTQLTQAGIELIRRAGFPLALVGTGGDPGHAAARATYRKAGFTPVPSEHLYLLLDGAAE
jgi:ribosomal protein S18 acetylase RimI-like enzyme